MSDAAFEQLPPVAQVAVLNDKVDRLVTMQEQMAEELRNLRNEWERAQGAIAFIKWMAMFLATVAAVFVGWRTKLFHHA